MRLDAREDRLARLALHIERGQLEHDAASAGKVVEKQLAQLACDSLRAELFRVRSAACN